MSKKQPLIPFSMTPASWGLKGVSRRIAEAEYLYEGEELERKLAEIRCFGDDLKRELAAIDFKYGRIDAYNYDHRLLEIDGKDSDPAELHAIGLKHQMMTEYEYDLAIAKLNTPRSGRDRELALLAVERKHNMIDDYDADHKENAIRFPDGGPTFERRKLDIEHNHDRMDDYDYEVAVSELEHPEGPDRDLAILEIKKRHHRIGEHDYEKERATIKEEPWIGIVDSGFDPEQGLNGVYFEFDWNEEWITYLRLNGYAGPSDAAVVDAWFADVCRAQGLAAANSPFEPVPFSGRV